MFREVRSGKLSVVDLLCGVSSKDIRREIVRAEDWVCDFIGDVSESDLRLLGEYNSRLSYGVVKLGKIPFVISKLVEDDEGYISRLIGRHIVLYRDSEAYRRGYDGERKVVGYSFSNNDDFIDRIQGMVFYMF